MTQDETTDKVLALMGLAGLPEDQKEEALADIMYALNIRVGKRVADQFSEEQFKEFERLTSDDSTDDEALGKWLAQNVPNFGQLLEEEAQAMKDWNADVVDQIMKESEDHDR